MYAGYVARRFGIMLLVVFLAVSINFALPRMMPGDPIQAQLSQLMASGGGSGDISAMVAAYQERFGLDQPIWTQYLAYWNALFQFDLGYSLANYPERVDAAIINGLPWTLGLLGVATVVSFTIGTLLGGLMGWPSTPRWVRGLGSGVVLLSSVPYFLIGMILLYLFAIVLRWFPAGGGMPFGTNTASFSFETMRGIVWHGTLPVLSIIIAEIGAWAIGMRGMLVSVLGEDYITLAEAKGNKPRRILTRYGMRNALLPQLTKLALTLGHIVSGAILVEVIFSYPGIGFRLYQAIQSKDYFVIQGIVLLLSVSIAIAMFILDLIYPLIDPRITAKGR
jgi:peptide/nickel transport system permease protein